MSPLDGPFGFVVIDKPAGLTSHACVSRMRRSYGLRRVGHGGTLDPAVTGVLPIALGPATRLLPYLPGEKTYQGSIQLGTRSSSDDLQGEILETLPWPALSNQGCLEALAPFRGTIQQRPPQVSAVHVDGERAHARARRGESMDLAARTVTIERLDLLDWNPTSGRLRIEVHCTAGTYIQALGFHLAQAHPLPESDSNLELPEPLSPLEALQTLPKRTLTDSEEFDWRCGRRLSLGAILEGNVRDGDAVVVCKADGSIAGMGLAEANQQLRPKVVFDAAG
jgi:tRNA pseudouridine55 synthase